MQNLSEDILTRYQSIKNSIPSNVTLTVVTKKHAMEKISPLINLGHKEFGENYIQEAKEKWSNISGINLKLIGNLQSNKIKDSLSIFDEIHTVHCLELAQKIKKNITQTTRTKIFYAQINIGNEEQKYGIAPDFFMDFFEKSPLEISGIMCIPPEGIDPSKYFLQMMEIKEAIKIKFGKELKLSMGMSNDFQTAIKIGSDEIRIGSAIFGER